MKSKSSGNNQLISKYLWIDITLREKIPVVGGWEENFSNRLHQMCCCWCTLGGEFCKDFVIWEAKLGEFHGREECKRKGKWN